MNNKGENKNPPPPRESFSELLEQLVSNLATMVHDEIALVTQEVREKVRAVRCAVLTIMAGALISFAAFLSLCAALIIGLTSYMAPVRAALVTGAALAVIGVVIGGLGYKKIKKAYNH